MITVKKSVLDSFIKTIVEGRSDGHSYSDVTGTMFDVDLDEPIKPSDMMSSQLAVEAPPVDDPEYVPGTKGELGRAAQLIAEEVPEDQIEKVYRQLHKILDNATDSHEDSNLSKELYESLKILIESDPGDDDEFGDVGDAADQFLKQHGITDHNIDDDVTDDFGGGSSAAGFKAGTKGAAIVQAKEIGDKNIKQIEDFEKLDKELRSKNVRPAKVDTSKIIERRLAAVKEASRIAYTDEEVPDTLRTLADAALTWEFEHPDAPKYIDAVFLAMHAVYEVNYQLIVANHGLEYGGLEIREKDTGFGKKLDIGIKQPGAPGSKEYNAGIMKDIQERYGLLYNNVIRFRSVFNMSDTELDGHITKILNGLNTHNPIFKEAFARYSEAIEKSGAAAIKELAALLRMAYKEDVEKEEVQVDDFIQRFFSRIRVNDYYNLTKFTYHAWKDAENIIKDYPGQILELMKKSKFYRGGVFKVAHPNIPEKTKDYSSAEMLEAIKVYVKGAVNASIDFHESQIIDQEAKKGDYVPDPEVLEKKRVAKQIKKLEKEANPTAYTHIAPLYGFSGESGLRQWVLKFPERKMRMMKFGKSEDDNFPGATKFVEITDAIYDVVMRNLPLYLTFLKNPEEAEIFTKAFMQLKTKDKKLVGDIGDEEQVRAQMDEFIRIFDIARQNLRQINDVSMELDTADIAIVAAALEEEEPVPFERLSPYLFQGDMAFTEEEIVDMVKAYMQGMYSIGGSMARSAVGEILSDVITVTDKPWKIAIAQMLQTNYKMDNATAMSKAEHFMGKKNIPDFEKPNKSKTKEFINLGIGEKEFYEVYAEAIKLYDDIINKKLDEKEKDARTLLSKLKRAEIEGIRNKNPGEQAAILDAAHDVYPFIIAMGIKSWDDMQLINAELARKKEEAQELKAQQQLKEALRLYKLLERLI